MPTVHLVRGPRKDNPYRDRLLSLSIEELIDAFNGEVGNPGWASSRASYLAALHEALVATGLDCSSFMEESSMSLGRKIRLENGKLIQLIPGGKKKTSR